MHHHYDVIIIGGGIMGCATAFELSQRDLEVVVLEKAVVGAGSTGKSSGIIRQHYSNEVTARMARFSLGVFQEFEDIVGGPCDFVSTGFLVLTPAKDLEGLRENVAMHRRVGINTELLEAPELKEMWPDLEVDDLLAAAYEPESGYADASLTVGGYAQAVRRMGGEIYQGVEVTGISFAGGRVTGVETSDGPFGAAAVVNCAGPWGARVAALAGVEAPINSCRVQVAFFRRPESTAGSHPVVADFVHGVYWRSETGRQTLVGMIDPAEEKAVVDPDRYNEGVEMEFVREAGERVLPRYPVLEQAESAGGYGALYAITPDWHPIIDEAIPGSGFYLCAGFSGHGFKLGPAVGRMTAAMVLDEQVPHWDRSLFRLSRYEQGDPVRGAYEYSIVG